MHPYLWQYFLRKSVFILVRYHVMKWRIRTDWTSKTACSAGHNNLVFMGLLSVIRCMYYNKCPNFQTLVLLKLCICLLKCLVEWQSVKTLIRLLLQQQSDLGLCTVCIWHFVRNFGVQNFRTYTVVRFECAGTCGWPVMSDGKTLPGPGCSKRR